MTEGTFSFGADFNCDVVLIDDGIMPVHFRIEVDSSRVVVTLEPGAEGVLQGRHGDVTELTPGVPEVWLSTQHLVTGGLDVHLSGAPVVLPERRSPRIVALARRLTGVSRAHLFGLSGVAAVLLVANTDFGASLSRPVGGGEVTRMTVALPAGPSLSRPPETSEPKMDESGAAPMTRAELEARLVAAGFVPDALFADPGGFSGVFYLDRAVERDGLRALITEEQLPLRPVMHLRSQMMSGINITLESAGGDARLVSLEDGRATLSGLRRDKTRRPAVIDMILSDVPGVTSVRFEEAVGADAEEVAADIAAIWTGPRPYVVLVDGRVVRPGQEIVNEIALRNVVSTDRITVERDGTSEEIMIQ